MVESFKTVVNFALKVLSPMQTWVALAVLTGIVIYAPDHIKTVLKVDDLPAVVINAFSVIFLLSIIVITIKILLFLWSLLIKLKIKVSKKTHTFDELSDEELVIIHLLSFLSEKLASFEREKWAVKKLVHKKLIHVPFFGIMIVDGSPMDDFELTESGQSFLSKNKSKLKEKFGNPEKFLPFANEACGGAFENRKNKPFPSN